MDFAPSVSSPEEFTVTVKDGKKNNVLKFGCAYRASLLNDLQRFRPNAMTGTRFMCVKITRSHQREDCVLVVREFGIGHVNKEGEEITTYKYQNITGVRRVKDDPSGIVLVTGDRQHMYATPDRESMMKQIAAAVTKLGRSQIVDDAVMTLQDYRNYRTFLGNDGSPKMAEFEVLKVTPRFPTPRVRKLTITETCIVERDTKTYGVISARPLTNVFQIVRQWDEPQNVVIEYKVRCCFVDHMDAIVPLFLLPFLYNAQTGESRTYVCTRRDELIASILDGCWNVGNGTATVAPVPLREGLRIIPLHHETDENVENIYMKRLAAGM